MPASQDEFESIFDLVGGAVGYRFRSGMFRKHALVRASGIKSGENPIVVDATAGLGRDAFLLASIGAHVTLLERSPDVFDLLRDSMAKASAAGPELAAVVARMTLMFGDARKLLADLQADVVLVDPMHPVRRNTALVKKEMRLLKELVGADSDASELMQAALAARCKRVVLKWPLRAPSLEGLRKPSHTITGRTVRYDVFMNSVAS
ncbi:MAG TPA: class I SAM-dependent methyltransferase [Bradyrhizobium sp.]